MKKTELIHRIVEELAANLTSLEKAARSSHAEATHESSKAENKYDTRGLEAAYLAGGQARQVKEIQDAIAIYQGLQPRVFGPNDRVELTALIELETDAQPFVYFIGPKSGGLEIRHGKQEIIVITPQSPLGQNLMGRKAGQRWTAKVGGSIVKYHVISVR